VFGWSLWSSWGHRSDAHGGLQTGDDSRAGSYPVNEWVAQADVLPGGFGFTSESQVPHPGATPVLADGDYLWVEFTPDLWFYLNGAPPWSWFPGLNCVVLSRHGRHPNPVPMPWPVDQPLPGAVNVAFLDGHGDGIARVALRHGWPFG
jgi:prepilin-type processing-associated H-X9-DG protein